MRRVRKKAGRHATRAAVRRRSNKLRQARDRRLRRIAPAIGLSGIALFVGAMAWLSFAAHAKALSEWNQRQRAAEAVIDAQAAASRDNIKVTVRLPQPPARPRAHLRHNARLAMARGGEEAAGSFASAGLTSSDLVNEARRYIGGNPTGRATLWCGAFMDMVLRRTGHRGGGNLARGYAHYGTRVSGPQVGAIVVLGRAGGGHVGVVSGVDASGNPIVISGNHNRRVAESVYPRSRVIAYVVPNG